MEIKDLIAQERKKDIITEYVGRFDDTAFGRITDMTVKNNEALLQIDASHAGVVTGNGMFYSPKKMKDGARSFIKPYRIPILNNHDTSLDPLGRVVNAEYIDFSRTYKDSAINSMVDSLMKTRKNDAKHNEISKKLFEHLQSNGMLADYGNKYSGLGAARIYMKISDWAALEKIKDGRYDTMSVSFHRGDLYCMECGGYMLSDACQHSYHDDVVFMPSMHKYVETSYVNVPADILAKMSNESNYPELAFASVADGVQLMGRDGKAIDIIKLVTKVDCQPVSEIESDADESAVDKVSGVKKYAIASSDYTWSKALAIPRIRDNLGSIEAPSGKYKNAFMWHDETRADSFSSYKLPFVDVVDGELKIVPNAIRAIAAALGGARGGIKGISDEEKAVLKKRVTSYMNMIASSNEENADDFVAPWDQEDEQAALTELAEIIDELKIEPFMDEEENLNEGTEDMNKKKKEEDAAASVAEVVDSQEAAAEAVDGAEAPAADAAIVDEAVNSDNNSDSNSDKPMLLDILNKESYAKAVNDFIDASKEEDKARLEAGRIDLAQLDSLTGVGPENSFIVNNDAQVEIAFALLDSHDAKYKKRIKNKIEAAKVAIDAKKAEEAASAGEASSDAVDPNARWVAVINDETVGMISKVYPKESRQIIFNHLFAECAKDNKEIKLMKQDLAILSLDSDSFKEESEKIIEKFDDFSTKMRPLIIDYIIAQEVTLGKVDKTDIEDLKTKYNQLSVDELREKFDLYSKIVDNNNVDDSSMVDDESQNDNSNEVIPDNSDQSADAIEIKSEQTKQLAVVSNVEIDRVLSDWKELFKDNSVIESQ